MNERQQDLADGLATKLKADENVAAAAVVDSGGLASERALAHLELLVLVRTMPFDLDMFGRRSDDRGGVRVTLTYYRPERLRTAIEDEAGCWLTSGLVLYSRSLYDPDGLLVELRRAVNSFSREKWAARFEFWLSQARAVPVLVARRKPGGQRPTGEEMLLGDLVAFARTLFLINRIPPHTETSLMNDMMNLRKRPQGIADVFEIAQGFDRYNLKKFRRAQKAYAAIISEMEDLRKAL